MSNKKPTQRQKPKLKERIENWREDNGSLVERGAMSIGIATDDLHTWKASQKGKRAGQYRYADATIAWGLTVKSVYPLPLRATILSALLIFPYSCNKATGYLEIVRDVFAHNPSNLNIIAPPFC